MYTFLKWMWIPIGRSAGSSDFVFYKTCTRCAASILFPAIIEYAFVSTLLIDHFSAQLIIELRSPVRCLVRFEGMDIAKIAAFRFLLSLYRFMLWAIKMGNVHPSDGSNVSWISDIERSAHLIMDIFIVVDMMRPKLNCRRTNILHRSFALIHSFQQPWIVLHKEANGT